MSVKRFRFIHKADDYQNSQASRATSSSVSLFTCNMYSNKFLRCGCNSAKSISNNRKEKGGIGRKMTKENKNTHGEKLSYGN